eukprot:1926803-Pleurochrysis_carterae.AAC.2
MVRCPTTCACGVGGGVATSMAGFGGGRAVSGVSGVSREELRTRATRKLKSGGYAECNFENHPALVLDPPAIMGATRREQSSDVYFWAVAPSAHSGNVIRVAPASAFKAAISGINQSGACRW